MRLPWSARLHIVDGLSCLLALCISGCSGTSGAHDGGSDDLSGLAGSDGSRASGDGGVVTGDGAVTAQDGSPLHFLTPSVQNGATGHAYSATFLAAGGTAPLAWSVSAGGLPDGLVLAPATGVLAGTPTAAGSFSFTVEVTDASTPAQSTTRVFALLVGGTQNLTACGALTAAGTTYVLQNDVTGEGTCFSVAANDISIDLAGHTVTYNGADQSSATHAVVLTNDNNTGFAIYGGHLVEGAGKAADASHVIDLGAPSRGPVIYGVTFDWHSAYAQAITGDYQGAPEAGAASIHDNTLHNGSAAICADVGCRDTLQSTSIVLADAFNTTTPADISGNDVHGGAQGAVMCDAPGCHIHDNVLDPGAGTVAESNDFAIYCWSSCDAFHNTIMSPLGATSEGRGIQMSGADCEQNGRTGCAGRDVHDNVVGVTERANNAEYGTGGAANGCPLGGAYGVQFDDQVDEATVRSNQVTATADACWATGLRVTDSESVKNVSHDNHYIAVRKSPSSPACEPIGDGTPTGCAWAYSMGGPTAFTSSHDFFQGDSGDFYVDWDGGSNVTFSSPTIAKGPAASADFRTFVLRNGGAPVSGIHFVDPVFTGGASATDTDLPAKSDNQMAVSMYVDWTLTLLVKKASDGTPVSGAHVVYEDALGQTACMATSDAQGMATCVLTQHRLHNDSAANQVEVRNPYAYTITATGCTTLAGSESVSATASETRSLTGC